MHRSLSEWLFFIPFSTIPHPVSFICLVPHSFRCRVVVKPENVLFQVRQDELQVTFSWPEIKAGGNFDTLRNSARLRECPKLKLWQQSKGTVLPKNAYCRKHTYFQKTVTSMLGRLHVLSPVTLVKIRDSSLFCFTGFAQILRVPIFKCPQAIGHRTLPSLPFWTLLLPLCSLM